MRSVLVVSVLLLVVVATGAFAQEIALSTARSLGMGNTRIGIANDGAAWYQNPAGLGMMNRKPMDGKTWANDAIGTYFQIASDDGTSSSCAASDSQSAWSLTWSGWDACKKYGAGAGYGNITDVGNAWGAGFGITFPKFPLALGISGTEISPDGPCVDSEFLWNVGAMYEFTQKNCAPIRIGALVRDVTSRLDDGPFLDLGASWAVIPNLLIALDVDDATSQIKTRWNAGAEYGFGTCHEWTARAGVTELVDNHDLTLGLGYDYQTWRLDAAWVDTRDSSTWSVGVGYSF